MKTYISIILLAISIIAKGQHYSIDTIAYNPESYSGAGVTIAFNSYSEMIPLGFQFCYYGNKYDSIRIGANGVVSFDSNSPFNAVCNWEIFDMTLPNPYSGVRPGIGVYFPWQALNPTIGGNITYASYGVFPNRVFVVSFDSVPMDSCQKVFKGQAKLFESTNVIETHIALKDTCLNWNQGRAAHGLEGPPILPLPMTPPYTNGDYISGRNYPNSVWTATNDGIRFTPIVDVCLPLLFKENMSSQNKFRLFPNPANQFATLEFPNPNKANHTLTIYNQLGQVVRILQNITDDKIIIERHNIPSGLYLLRLDDGERNIGTGKLAFE